MIERKLSYILLSLFFIFTISCSKDNSIGESETEEQFVVTVSTQNMTFNIEENPDDNQLIGTVIGETNQGQVSFLITEQSPENSFKINSSTGELFVDDKFIYDYETRTEINGTVKVFNGEIFKESYINVSITNSDDVYSGDVDLKTQDEVNEFASNNYTTITGNLHIGYTESGTKIIDLSVLSSLSKINGNLLIVKNDDLKNLEGLNNIQSVDVCVVFDNNSIEDISALSNLNYVESIRVSSNPLLKEIECFSNITSLSGFLEVVNNNSLTNLLGLHNISTINRSIQIRSNVQLNNLNLKKLINAYRIELAHNHLLVNLEGISNLETVELDLSITNNDNLLEINALNKLKSLSTVKINSNIKLNSLSGLSNITELNTILIQDNESLINLNGLENVESVGNSLDIIDNNQLDNFCSLTKLSENQFPSNYLISGNKFNPTMDDLKNGNCSL